MSRTRQSAAVVLVALFVLAGCSSAQTPLPAPSSPAPAASTASVEPTTETTTEAAGISDRPLSGGLEIKSGGKFTRDAEACIRAYLAIDRDGGDASVIPAECDAYSAENLIALASEAFSRFMDQTFASTK